MELSITIVRQETGHYLSRCPALPGCQGRGTTVQEAQVKIHQAICGYLASLDGIIPAKVELVVRPNST